MFIFILKLLAFLSVIERGVGDIGAFDLEADTLRNEATMNMSLAATGSTLGAPPRVHPPGVTGMKLEFGSMGSTKAEKLLGTGEALTDLWLNN